MSLIFIRKIGENSTKFVPRLKFYSYQIQFGFLVCVDSKTNKKEIGLQNYLLIHRHTSHGYKRKDNYTRKKR